MVGWCSLRNFVPNANSTPNQFCVVDAGLDFSPHFNGCPTPFAFLVQRARISIAKFGTLHDKRNRSVTLTERRELNKKLYVNKQKKMIRKKNNIHLSLPVWKWEQTATAAAAAPAAKTEKKEKRKWREKEQRKKTMRQWWPDSRHCHQQNLLYNFIVIYYMTEFSSPLFVCEGELGCERRMRAGTHSLTDQHELEKTHNSRGSHSSCSSSCEIFRNRSLHSQLKVPTILISDLFTHSKNTLTMSEKKWWFERNILVGWSTCAGTCKYFSFANECLYLFIIYNVFFQMNASSPWHVSFIVT